VRIGEVARRAGVNIETLRYYERRGLLAEPPRSPNGHRSYAEDTVRFVQAVKEAQGLGFTLAEIKEHLRVARCDAVGLTEATRVRLAAKIDEVDAKIASLQRVREELARVVGCACRSLDHCTCGAAYLARRGREPEIEHGTLLHVTNGESAGNTLRRTALGGAVLGWNDVLHEGPVPSVPAARLRELRARFLSDAGWGARPAILAALERRDRSLERALEGRQRVVLWFEHDLYDQLQLLQILSFVDDSAGVELIVVGAFEGRPDFHGLGELSAAELETLWALRAPLSDEQLELGRLAWEAFRSPDPTGIEDLLGRETAALPFLEPALRRLLEELPDSGNGLSRSERGLLEELAAGPAAPGRLFVAVQAREEAPFDGDTWVWRRLAELGSGRRPLLAPAEGGRLSPPPPRGEARRFAATTLALTDVGRAVLEGRADRVEVLGIDRWLGGTHLRPSHVWRWDSQTTGVVAPDAVS
jgi:DNA-binding transcriptional MerR regulator